MSSMTSYSRLKRDFERRVKELQKKCPHKNLTEWLEEHWAIAHPTGFQIRHCKRCNAEVSRRTSCLKCGKVIEEKDFVKGEREDKPRGRPFGDIFCQDCEDAWQKFLKENPMPKGKKLKIVHTDGSKVEEPYQESFHRVDLYQKFMGRTK